MASLEACGAHPDLLKTWSMQYGDELLPIQEKAVLDGQVLAGKSIVGCGPTGCGKTFIGEMAATHAATHARRTVYLVPTKALAEAKYHQFSQAYRSLGLRVDISTAERRGADSRLSRGDFDVLVTVPEKLWALVLDSPGLVGTVGTVVADELQVVGDPDRGPCLELILARFRQVPSIQIVGLSAVLSNGPELADWLGARLIQERRRPVELRKGIWSDGVFRYLEHNSGLASWEELPASVHEDMSPLEAAACLAGRLAQQGESTLLFVPDRLSTVRGAQMIADELGSGGAQAALDALGELTPTRAVVELRELLQCGVAFHNADLHFAERQVIEQAFAAGEIRCLVCTTTLAVGVNLPARNVIVDPRKWCAVGSGRPTLAPMGRAEFENMAGRAGRLGFVDQFGRAILLGEAGFASDCLLKRYIEAEAEPVVGQVFQLPPLRRLVLLKALEHAGDPLPGSLRLLSVSEDRVETPEETWATETAVKWGLAEEGAFGDGLLLTGAGRAAAASGLAVESVGRFLVWLRESGRAPSNTEALILASQSREAREVPLPQARPDQPWRGALEHHLRRGGAWSESLGELVSHGLSRADDCEHAARVALIVAHWIGHGASGELEEQTGVPAGRAAALCAAVGWAIQCIARLAKEYRADPLDVQRLERFGEAVSASLPEECLELHRLRIPALQRDHALVLMGHGISNKAAIAAATDEQLRAVLPDSLVAVLRRVAGCPTSPEALSETAGEASNESGAREQDTEGVPLLALDPDRPDVALVNGSEVRLRPMEYQLLTLLAAKPRRCVSFDLLYDALWGARDAVEPQQIYWHRHNLSRKLEEALPGRHEPVVRTIPRRGLMLDLPRERVLAAS
ncbi:MAG: DEAD/DEAH box helicase [Armatimonadetes bacterium]|nr:DEAD/DEAH box helicase [Armatimonadota bacterium]